jgi:hypothetical protein
MRENMVRAMGRVMSPTSTRLIDISWAHVLVAATLFAACESPEYMIGASRAARGGTKSSSTGGTFHSAGKVGTQGGSESAGTDGTAFGEFGGAGSGGDNANAAAAGIAASSTDGGGSNFGGVNNGGANPTAGATAIGVAGAGGAIGTGGSSKTSAVGAGRSSTGGATARGGAAAGGAAAGGVVTIAGADAGGAVTTGGANNGGAVPAAGADNGGTVTTGGTNTGGTVAAAGANNGGTVATGGTVAAAGRNNGGTVATGGANTGGTVATGGAGTGGATIDPDLVLWYKFDEATGTTAADSSGKGHTGTLTNAGSGTAAFSTTHQVGTGSVNLNGSSATNGGYVVVPSSLQAMGATTAVTISCWVYVRASGNWQRVFDFGSNNTTYTYLTVQQIVSTPNSPRFGISTGSYSTEQRVDMTTPAVLSTSVWHFMVVVLRTGSPYTATLYIDNVEVGTNTAMTLHPSDLGATTNNWLGKSQFPTDDFLFNGMLDDFRIYKRALTTAELTALYAVR